MKMKLLAGLSAAFLATAILAKDGPAFTGIDG